MTSPIPQTREQLLAEAAGLSQAPVVSPDEITAIKQFTGTDAPKIAYDFAMAHPTEATVLVLEMAPRLLPQLLSSLAEDLPALRRYKHAQSIGDDTVTAPGLTPAVQANGTTPAAALGAGTGGTTPADQDPLVAEFANLLASNRGAAEALLDNIRAAVTLRASDPSMYQLVSAALLNLLAAATKSETALSPDERQWVLVNDGGQPALKAHRDALHAASAATTELNRVTGPIRAIVSNRWLGALDAAKWLADEVAAHRGGSVSPSDAEPLGRTLEAIKRNIEEANTQPRPRAARPPNS